MKLRQRVAFGLAVGASFLIQPTAAFAQDDVRESVKDCSSSICMPLRSGAYPNIVVGTVTHVADEAEMQAIYRQQRKNGVWKRLAENQATYLKGNAMLVLADGAQPQALLIPVHMSREELANFELQVGDLVRYVPRQVMHHDSATAHNPYYFGPLAGCVAVLCRKQDTSCFANYAQGVFAPKSGVQVAPDTDRPIKGGAVIDTATMYPVKRSAR